MHIGSSWEGAGLFWGPGQGQIFMKQPLCLFYLVPRDYVTNFKNVEQ